MKVGKTNFIERYFGIRASGSNIRTEILAGLTTFFAMSYILFINPSVLAKAGMEWGSGLPRNYYCFGNRYVGNGAGR